MKSKEVLQLLGISRVTLYKYVKNGTIKVTQLDNGYYDYDQKSVFKLIKKENRKNVLYARVSTYKQSNDLANQVNQLIEFCNGNKIKYDQVYKEISSGTDMNRKEFSKLLDDVIHYKISNIYITYKDRLTRLSFSTIETIFNKFGTHIIIINDLNVDKNNDNEIFEELISLLHLFSTSMYSNRRKKKLNIISKDLLIFDEDAENKNT